MKIKSQNTLHQKTCRLFVIELDDGRKLTLMRTQEMDEMGWDDDIEPYTDEDAKIHDSLDDDTREQIDELVRPDLND